LREYLAVAKRDYRDVLLGLNIRKNQGSTHRKKGQKVRELFEKLGIDPLPSLLE
jgi:hypothetical protein